MKSAAEIIDELGGSTAVGALLGLPATTVASWKSRKSIPVQHWTPLIASAEARGIAGVTAESLFQLAQAKTASPPTAPDQTETEKAKAS